MRHNKAVLYLISFLLFFIIYSNKLSAQQTVTVKGIVTDEKKQPAAQATIGIAGKDKFTVAGADGHYQLQLTPGKHKLVCTMIGYETQELDIVISGAQPATHNFHLKKSDNKQLKEVTIQSISTKKQIETSGFAVNVVETREASLRNIQTNELLDRTVGVRVRQNGGVGSAVEYNLNGMSGRSVGIFIDGLEISTYGSSFNLNNIPPSMIERIEVYKGVLPSHLSGDYMGGAINVILKKDVSQNNITASVSYGSFNTFQADASGMYRNQKNGFTVKASGFYTYTDNDYETWGKFSKYIAYNGVVTRNYRAKRFNDSYKSYGGRFELGFTNVKWADVFLFGYNGSETHNEIPHGQTMGRPYVGRFNEAQAHVFSLNYTKKNLFTEGLNLTFNGVYSNRNTYLQDTVGWVYNWDGNYRLDINKNPMYRVGEGQQGDKVITDINRKITNFRTNLSYDIFSGHRLSVNHVFYTVNRNDEDLLKPVDNNTLKTKSDLYKNVVALNYEGQTISNKLKTNLFVKYYQQNVGRNSPVVSVVDGKNVVTMVKTDGKVGATGYGLAASYTVVPRVIIIGSAERAVRMPGESEILGDPNENVLSNFTIRPEVSNNFNIGFRLGSFEFGKHKFTLSTNAFWRNVKDKIMRQANANLVDQEVEVSPFINLGKAQSLGFEGELGYIYNNKLNFLFSISKFNSVFKGTGSAADRLSQYYNKQVPNEPFFTMNGNVQYRLNNIIQKKSIVNLFYNFGYVAPFNTVWPKSEWFTTPAQLVHDAGVNYRFPNRKLIVSIDAKNIFNSEVYDNFGVQKPGRGFYGKITYTIGKF
ncbi:MAG: TonB-dependent receptor [Sphingobacteriales bacterium 40-81]|nr:MAG: TonB-dependent receptor [Sphingobacteriales bacterium 40-81]